MTPPWLWSSFRISIRLRSLREFPSCFDILFPFSHLWLTGCHEDAWLVSDTSKTKKSAELIELWLTCILIVLSLFAKSLWIPKTRRYSWPAIPYAAARLRVDSPLFNWLSKKFCSKSHFRLKLFWRREIRALFGVLEQHGYKAPYHDLWYGVKLQKPQFSFMGYQTSQGP